MSHKLRSTSPADATLEQTQNPWKLEKKTPMKVSLSTETLIQVFGFLSRRELCQLIYPISNQVYTIATSSRLLPVVHSISSLSFWVEENCDFATIYSLDREKWNSGEWHSKKMTVDEFKFKFNIAVKWCEYLRRAVESFVGCRLELFTGYCNNPAGGPDSLHEQVIYLLQNVFHSPTWVKLETSYYLSNLPILHARVIPKCNRLEILFSELDDCTHDTNSALLDWLTAKSNKEISGNEKRHLVLERYSRSNILDMIQQVRNDFEGATEIQMTDIVITFAGSRENPEYGFESYPWENDSLFSIDNTLTGERLTLFDHIREEPWYYPSHVSRLWRRRVTNETEDAVKFSCLLGEMEFLMDDRPFYSYPICHEHQYKDIA
ncbi:hypothetical protein DdX_15816 [Ditylenchus destructor]|uniref:F-box domain-containing protein n=1 Tax=Ditylenchus destructor TaxID=166010 RepID=A0AAD4MPN0_9BILA|nr:hypothetical protein DdX_15816 [Ditylenchus destructor]